MREGLLREDAPSRPLTPLQAGESYELTYDRACNQKDGPEIVGSAFQVTAAQPLPATMGTIGEPVVTVASAYGTGSQSSTCTTTVRAAVARISFTPSPALAPFLPVTRFRLSIDGGEEKATSFGVGPNDPVKGAYFTRPLLEVFGACEPTKVQPAETGLSLGIHTFSLAAEVADAATQPTPLTGTFELSCDGVPDEPSGGGAAGSAGDPGGGSGIPGTAGSTGATPPGGSSDGCATSRAGARTNAALLLLGGALVAKRRRGRGRRRS